MNPFFFSFIALCITQGAIAQYQAGNGGSYGQQQSAAGYQRKMSPSPQSYGQNSNAHHQQRESYEPMSNYEQPAPMAAYQQPQQQYQPQQHQQQQQQQSYRAPSSASVSTYDERTPAASSGYAKAAPKYEAAAAAASSYGQTAQRPAATSYGQQQASSYGQQQQSYAKAAPKYEEPSHPPMPFAWGYDINDGYGGAQYHKESGDEYGKRTGSYGYTDAYGIYRQVDYVADENGFRATIKTNEPGTANESPADVELHAYEPPSNYYAGNTNSYSSATSGSSYGSGKQSSGSSYGQQQQQQQQSYSRPAASASTSSYGAPAQAAAYAPVAQQQRSSYKAAPAASGYSRPQASSYEPAASQYASSSAIVPVYQKATAAAAKRY